MWELIGAALGAAASVGVPLLGWVLKLQGRVTRLETWQEITSSHWAEFERRVLDKLENIEQLLHRKADK